MWLSDSGDIFQGGKIAVVKGLLQFTFCGQIRRKHLCKKNNSLFLLSLGCWVEVLVVGGGYRVNGPHPIS